MSKLNSYVVAVRAHELIELRDKIADVLGEHYPTSSVSRDRWVADLILGLLSQEQSA